jgi:hypothetical protein
MRGRDADRKIGGPRYQFSPPEQAHDDREISIGKKRTAEFRHRDRIRRVDDSSYGKDADRKIGGPRYLVSPDDALRAALQTPPEKKRVVRAAMRIPQDKIEIFKEETEDNKKERKETEK